MWFGMSRALRRPERGWRPGRHTYPLASGPPPSRDDDRERPHGRRTSRRRRPEGVLHPALAAAWRSPADGGGLCPHGRRARNRLSAGMAEAANVILGAVQARPPASALTPE